MNKRTLVGAALLLWPFLLVAHNGNDPIKELKENHRRITTIQQTLESSPSATQQLALLQSQLGYLQSNAMLLRHLIAAEPPRISEEMSQYRVDYLDEIEQALRDLHLTIKQMRELAAQQSGAVDNVSSP